eukprot:TRINITY_DN15432_c0_g1_i1.p1 TRINITY_DN15432_c0_g1~~TRINITY_DN15432_c0_g1_i1.p1  ORF type:complete len:106 (-),score=30.69 TRINITY_DN15432_c0_g1_i1:98-415(-)
MGRHHRRTRERELDEAEEQLSQMLSEAGHKDELKSMLLTKLESCGWKDQVRLVIKDIVKEKGIDKISVEDLVQETAPHASQLVPDQVRMEMLDEVKRFLETQDED